jgi:predicted ATPase
VSYLTGVGPVAVLLDHMHRADGASLRLLAHLAESVPSSRLLLVVAYESGAAAGLSGTLAALARSGLTGIELTGLTVAETRALAGSVLGREVGGGAAEELRARTGGNPFLLRELVSLAGEQCPDRPDTVPLPGPVRDVVLRRVVRLPPAAAEVLRVAAVAGRHFDVEVVAAAATVELEVALDALDSAVAAGLVVEDRRRLGWFRFTHALTVEALRETTGRLRRAGLLRRIGADSRAAAVPVARECFY